MSPELASRRTLSRTGALSCTSDIPAKFVHTLAVTFVGFLITGCGTSDSPSETIGTAQERGEEAVPELLEFLATGDVPSRQKAATALQTIKSPEAVAPLTKAAIEDESNEVRVAAAKALTAQEDPGLTDGLTGLMAKGTPEVRALARAKLVDIGKEAVPSLEKALKGTEDVTVRCDILETLAQAGGDSSLDLIAGYMSDANEKIRETAVRSLGSIRTARSVEHLTKAVRNRSPVVVRAAVSSLAEIGGSETVPPLVWALGDLDEGIQEQSHSALTKLGYHWKWETGLAAKVVKDSGEFYQVPLVAIARHYNNRRQYSLSEPPSVPGVTDRLLSIDENAPGVWGGIARAIWWNNSSRYNSMGYDAEGSEKLLRQVMQRLRSLDRHCALEVADYILVMTNLRIRYHGPHSFFWKDGRSFCRVSYQPPGIPLLWKWRRPLTPDGRVVSVLPLFRRADGGSVVQKTDAVTSFLSDEDGSVVFRLAGDFYNANFHLGEQMAGKGFLWGAEGLAEQGENLVDSEFSSITAPLKICDAPPEPTELIAYATTVPLISAADFIASGECDLDLGLFIEAAEKVGRREATTSQLIAYLTATNEKLQQGYVKVHRDWVKRKDAAKRRAQPAVLADVWPRDRYGFYGNAKTDGVGGSYKPYGGTSGTGRPAYSGMGKQPETGTEPPQDRESKPLPPSAFGGEILRIDAQAVPGSPMAILQSTRYAIAWSPDGAYLATVAGDQVAARVWEVKDGKLVRTLKGHKDVVNDVAWSPDGQSIATASNDGTIKIWKASNGEESRTVRPEAREVQQPSRRKGGEGGYEGETFANPSKPQQITGPVLSVSWRGDGNRVVAGLKTGHVFVFDPERSGKGELRLFTNPPVSAIAWNHGSSSSARGMFGTRQMSGLVLIWDSRNEYPIRAFGPRGLNSVIQRRSSRRSKTEDKPRWTMETAKTTPYGDGIGIAWSPDGSLFAIASGALNIWDVSRSSENKLVHSLSCEPLGNEHLSAPVSEKHFLGYADYTLYGDLWEANEPGTAAAQRRSSQGKYTSVTWSPDGKRLAAGGNSRRVVVWEVPEDDDGQWIPESFDCRAYPEAIAWCPVDKTLATLDHKGVIRIWNAHGE